MNSIFTHLVSIVYQMTGAEAAVAGSQKVEQALLWDRKSGTFRQIEEINGAMANMGETGNKAGHDIGEGLDNASNKTNDFTKAMNRALIVAPVWMVIRGAIQFLTGSLKEGAEAFISFDKALINSEQFVHGFSGSTTEAVTALKQRIIELSQQSAVPVEQLAAAFGKFGAIGFDFSSAVNGMDAASKLAMATQGDATVIAESMATAMRVLGDSVDKSIPPQERNIEVAAKLYQITKNNNVSINDLAASLKTFVSTANITNTSLDQTIALFGALNDAGLNSSRAGLALKTSFTKFLEDLPKIAADLGIKVVPEIEGTFNSLVRVLGAVKQLSSENRLSEVSAALKDVFGGIRGGETAKALIGVFDNLNKNMALMSNSSEQLSNNMTVLGNRMDKVRESASFQVTQFQNNKKIWEEAFITGIVGGDNFADAMKRVNDILVKTTNAAKDTGDSIRRILTEGGPVGASIGAIFDALTEKANATGKTQQVIGNALRGELDLATSISLQQFIQNKLTDQELLGRQNILNALAKVIDEKQKSAAASQSEIPSEEIINKNLAERHNLYSTFADAIEKQTAKQKILTSEFIAQQVGISQASILQQKMVDTVDELVKQYNDLQKAAGDVNKTISTQQVLGLLNSESYQQLLQLTDRRIIDEKQINDLVKQQKDINEARIKDAETEKNGELELLRLRGASNAELIRATLAMDTRIFGEAAVAKSLKDNLEMEKLITREKLNQVDIGNDTLTLFKLAKKEGNEVATQVGKFLTGQIDFRSLSEMPKALSAFQEFFSSRFEAIQAAQFFGIPFNGFGQLGGQRQFGQPGSLIPIPEFEALNNLSKNLLNAPKATTISGLNITVNADVTKQETKKEKVSKMLDDIASAIRTDPNVQKALEERIEQF